MCPIIIVHKAMYSNLKPNIKLTRDTIIKIMFVFIPVTISK